METVAFLIPIDFVEVLDLAYERQSFQWQGIPQDICGLDSPDALQVESYTCSQGRQ